MDDASGPPVRLLFPHNHIAQVWLFERKVDDPQLKGLCIGAVAGALTLGIIAAQGNTQSGFAGAGIGAVAGALIGLNAATPSPTWWGPPPPPRVHVTRRLIYNAPPPPHPAP